MDFEQFRSGVVAVGGLGMPQRGSRRENLTVLVAQPGRAEVGEALARTLHGRSAMEAVVESRATHQPYIPNVLALIVDRCSATNHVASRSRARHR